MLTEQEHKETGEVVQRLLESGELSYGLRRADLLVNRLFVAAAIIVVAAIVFL